MSYRISRAIFIRNNSFSIVMESLSMSINRNSNRLLRNSFQKLITISSEQKFMRFMSKNNILLIILTLNRFLFTFRSLNKRIILIAHHTISLSIFKRPKRISRPLTSIKRRLRSARDQLLLR